MLIAKGKFKIIFPVESSFSGYNIPLLKVFVFFPFVFLKVKLTLYFPGPLSMYRTFSC
jgi:hypothetical protein